jgi:hypothetical protein
MTDGDRTGSSPEMLRLLGKALEVGSGLDCKIQPDGTTIWGVTFKGKRRPTWIGSLEDVRTALFATRH